MPANLEGTLSHQVAPPGAPEMAVVSFKRNDSSTAFLIHWLTVQPSGPFSATRTCAFIEKVERRLDGIANDAGGALADALALLPHGIDRALKLGGGRRLGAFRETSDSGWLSARLVARVGMSVNLATSSRG